MKLFISISLTAVSLFATTTTYYLDELPIQVNQYGPVYEGNIYTTFLTYDKKRSINENYAIVLSPNAQDLLMHKRGRFYNFKKYTQGIYSIHVSQDEFDVKKRQRLELWDANFEKIAEYPFEPLSENQTLNYHESALLNNGHLMILIDVKTFWNVNGIKTKVLYNIVKEITPDGTTVFEWNSSHHFHLRDLTETHEALMKEWGRIDSCHINAIVIDNDENILLSSRHLDEITKVDRISGEIIWRMGGKNNQFTFINDPKNGFTHQHSPNRLENGNLLVYDNGNNHTPHLTRVVEYEIDEENKTATLVWEYKASYFARAMGSCQRLSNGNTLIGWGFKHHNLANIVEVTADQSLLLEVIIPKNYLIYRAFKYE